jgi:hypothetical protein
MQLALPRPQHVDIRERKRRRTEEPFPTSTDEATTENTVHDITVALPPPGASTDHADTDPVMDTHPNPRATGANSRWTPDEDKTLKDAVPAQGHKDWETIASLVPGRTHKQCRKRWVYTLASKSDPMTARTGK